MIRSRPRWVRSSRTLPLTPRPSMISVASERDTTSREASSSLFGAYLLMKRSPSEFRRMPPSPRAPSVTSTPLGLSVVGWNCMNSMSFSGTPASRARPIPSPVEECELVEGR